MKQQSQQLKIKRENSLLFAKPDRKDRFCKPILIKEDEALEWNEKGYGIFRTVNGFKNNRRKKEFLKNINGWSCEIDEGSKEGQLKRIMHSPLKPSLVIESKRGYQLIFYSNNAKTENYREISKVRLIPYFNADPKAWDISRIIREPGYYHCKDRNNPFLVRIIWENSNIYTEKQIRGAFPLVQDKKEKYGPKHQLKQSSKKYKFLISQEEALLRLSGSETVNGEVFTFYHHGDSTKQIVINNRATSCWIDKKGMIGSSDNGGPTIVQWLLWYGHTENKVQDILRNLNIINQ